MLLDYPFARNYGLAALESAPEMIDYLLRGLTAEEADRRPDPERFTIREIVAHIADLNEVFLGRMQRTCAEECPLLPDCDEGELAIVNNYASTNPKEQFQRFRESRAQMVEFLRVRATEDWTRLGNRPEIGLLSLEAQALLVVIHDAYHLHQIKQWREFSG